MQNITGINNIRAEHKYLMLAESLTLLILVILAFFCVRPLLEEWAIFNGLCNRGLDYLKMMELELPLRPFHMGIYVFQWLIGGGKPIGVSITGALLIIARYFIARWAVSPFVNGYFKWAMATLAALLIGWPALWLGRYASAQLSSLLFFAFLGFAIRITHKISFFRFMACSVLTTLMLMTYEALTLCLLAIPILSLFWKVNEYQIYSFKNQLTKSGVLIFSLLSGFILYAAYALIIFHYLHNFGYEGIVAQDLERMLSLHGFLLQLNIAYKTVFLSNILLFSFFMAILYLFVSMSSEQSIFVPTLLLFFGVLLLPFLSLIYLSHLHDTDRVLFPVSVGFVLICMTYIFGNQESLLCAKKVFLIVIILLSYAALSAIKINQYNRLQKMTISHTLHFIKKNKPKSLLIKDFSGTLGDIYTLYNNTLSLISGVYGIPTPIVICTPLSVDRLHYDAQRFPLPSTKRCEELSQTLSTQKILTARMVNDRLLLFP